MKVTVELHDFEIPNTLVSLRGDAQFLMERGETAKANALYRVADRIEDAAIVVDYFPEVPVTYPEP